MNHMLVCKSLTYIAVEARDFIANADVAQHDDRGLRADDLEHARRVAIYQAYHKNTKG